MQAMTIAILCNHRFTRMPGCGDHTFMRRGFQNHCTFYLAVPEDIHLTRHACACRDQRESSVWFTKSEKLKLLFATTAHNNHSVSHKVGRLAFLATLAVGTLQCRTACCRRFLGRSASDAASFAKTALWGRHLFTIHFFAFFFL